MLTKQRNAGAESAVRTDLWGNAALALFKGIVAVLSGSKSLLADAIRTAAVSAETYAGRYGARHNRKQPKEGRSRIGKTVSVLLPVLFLIAGLEIGIAAVRDMTEAAEASLKVPHWSSLAAIVAAILVQQFLLPPKERGLGLFVSLAALIGTGGALVGKQLELPALYYLDPACAIVIAVVVLLDGYRMFAAFMRKEQRFAADQYEDADDLMQLIQRVEGVITVESLRAREQGHYVAADVVISVNPRISVLEGHHIAKRVKQLLMMRFSHVTEVQIHVEPYDPGYPYKSNHDPNQEHAPTLLQ
ncbi:cation diffusion facilitator family transporter [Paenibacillus sp. NPDC058071]|uniref:cation diffusion facilitator family transporter n=1 Tax=Paenibacillus sp. NPDC058071 TaxID=3346326 RepID=UPI0036DA2C7A